MGTKLAKLAQRGAHLGLSTKKFERTVGRRIRLIYHQPWLIGKTPLVDFHYQTTECAHETSAMILVLHITNIKDTQVHYKCFVKVLPRHSPHNIITQDYSPRKNWFLP
ncbi:unknown protein [Bathycoccus prasinos]|uniref:Uncharacterized protein n=1 Tax=Bathycoccus prasinos TaxID=41875 RepID=K8ES26_9CHLO|nr:unknown protein [Bathycoccus prasinos]CCO20759.1 unknown protein [Bathycoccus prasinos]|eukprot:XP_007508040.1 unknown protein [Bathycoccus prasinos]